jgi:uncharacterized protein
VRHKPVVPASTPLRNRKIQAATTRLFFNSLLAFICRPFMQPNLQPFHLAFPVTSLANARAFYGGLLGCPEGRASDDWVDFNFFGHQIVAHLAPPSSPAAGHRGTSAVDGDNVPVRHFGMVLTMPKWQALADRLRAAGVSFVVEPHIRFAGQVGEQATMFFLDPCGNALEFKAFADPARLFAK